MKKNLLKLLTTFAICSLFFSCDFDGLQDSTYRDPLNVKLGQSNTVLVSIPGISPDTEYITIYRFHNNVTKAKDTDKGTPVGIIYPKNYSTGSYTFEDCYAIQGNTYVYRARYYTAEDDTALTRWSSEIKVTAPCGIATPVKYDENDLEFIFNSTTYTLKNKKTFTVLNDGSNDLDPMFVISCSSGSQAIPYPGDKLTADSEIDLRTLLPSYFFDQPLTIEGIIGKRDLKEGTGASQKTLQCLFCEITPLTIQGNINIPSKSGQGGLDFS